MDRKLRLPLHSRGGGREAELSQVWDSSEQNCTSMNVSLQTPCVEILRLYHWATSRVGRGCSCISRLHQLRLPHSFGFGWPDRIGHCWAILHSQVSVGSGLSLLTLSPYATFTSQWCPGHLVWPCPTLTFAFGSSKDLHEWTRSASCPRPFPTFPTAALGLGSYPPLVPIQKEKSLTSDSQSGLVPFPTGCFGNLWTC